MKRNHLIALGAAVLVVGILGYVVYRHTRGTKSKTLLGSGVPPYVPGGSFKGPPLPASNKVSNTLQDISNVLQTGSKLSTTAKNTWGDVKDFFA